MRRGSSLGALSNSKVANELFASASSAKGASCAGLFKAWRE
jgi:hypothetical protein